MKKIILLSAIVIVVILFASPLYRGFLSLLIVLDSLRPPEQAVMGKFTRAPVVTRVAMPGMRGKISAALYRARGEGKPFPLLLVRGLQSIDRDDQQVALLANNLARAGFLVLVPDIEGMRTYRIESESAEDVLLSFQYLAALAPASPRGGLMGIGYGSGPVQLAAADRRIRDKVGVIAILGGYYDLHEVLRYILTGSFEYGKHRGRVRPDDSLRWELAYRNLNLLPRSEDRAKLRELIQLRNKYEKASAERIARSLDGEAKSLYDIMANKVPDRFDELYRKLPRHMKELLQQMSPSRATPNTTAAFIIVHGMDDYSVPYTESLKIANALGDKQHVTLSLPHQIMQREQGGQDAYGWYNRYIMSGWSLFLAVFELTGWCSN